MDALELKVQVGPPPVPPELPQPIELIPLDEARHSTFQQAPASPTTPGKAG